MCECRPCRCEHDRDPRAELDDGGIFPAPGRVTEGGTADFPAGRPATPARPDGDRDDTNFNPDGSRRGRDERRPDYKVRLMCRTFVGDVGARPIGGFVFWESPDIWIEGASGDPDVATPGVVNKVMVHVWNIGPADSWGTHVDLYWCDPSIGINPAVAHPIGSTTLPLAAGQHQVVAFDWVPTFVNGGHSCLVAQVYNPVADPVVAPFNPRHDRHVAQRNISVVEVAASQTLDFAFFTQNFALRPATIAVEVHRVERDALQDVAMALGTHAWRSAGAPAPVLLPPATVRQAAPSPDDPLVSGVFRETLQGVPGPSTARRLGGALRALAAPRGDAPRRGEAPPAGEPTPRGDAPRADEPTPRGAAPRADDPTPRGDAPRGDDPTPRGDTPRGDDPTPRGDTPRDDAREGAGEETGELREGRRRLDAGTRARLAGRVLPPVAGRPVPGRMPPAAEEPLQRMPPAAEEPPGRMPPAAEEPPQRMPPAAEEPPRRDAGHVSWEPVGTLGGTLRMQPGQRVRFGLQVEVPADARRGTASVYRIIERTAGEVTGGVTVVVRTT